MESNELRNKVRDIKSRIEHLQSIFSMSYKDNSKENTNKLIIIRRNLDKLKTAARYLSNIDIGESNRLIAGSVTNEFKNIYRDTIKSMEKLEKLASSQLRVELNRSESREFITTRKNLDSLKLAYNALRNIDFEFTDNQKVVNKVKKVEEVGAVKKILGEEYGNQQESEF